MATNEKAGTAGQAAALPAAYPEHEAGNFRAAVLAALGNAPDHLTPGEFQRFATNGKRSDQSGWCKLFVDGRAGVFGCMRQGISDMWTAQARRFMSPAVRIELARQLERAQRHREERQRQQYQNNAYRNAQLWAACRLLTSGDPVARYLAHRLKSEPVRLPAALRFHPGLAYWHEGRQLGTHPAMVAALTSPAGELLALHRTYLTLDGRKADVPTAKKLTGASGPVLGGCIALGEPNAVGTLGIAEGVETAMAASQASGLPVRAAYAAGALAAWKWPAGLRHLVILADADKAGAEAADELRKRARAHGLRVTVMTPTTPGADWCDVWAARQAGVLDSVPAVAMEVTP